MPYKMRNRFLILGLTGPLGSGCTSTAKFLSGKWIEGFSIKEVLENQTNKVAKDLLNEKIKNAYLKIDQLKKASEHRGTKADFGPYKESFIDSSSDPRLTENERKANFNHEKLKIYLKKREVYKVLHSFLEDDVFYYNNINESDITLFGFQPFIYISFTEAIIKLALEKYKEPDGKKFLENYFTYKIKKSTNKKQKAEFNKLKTIFINNFNIDDQEWKSYHYANLFIVNRDYRPFPSSFIIERIEEKDKSLTNKINELHMRFIVNYYKYLKKLKSILGQVKTSSPATNKGEFVFALSEVLQDWGDNIRATGNPYVEKKPYESYVTENLYTLSDEINKIIKFLRFRIRYVDKNFSILPPDGKKDKIPALFVVECFRNPFEIDFFRSRYSEFFLISITANKNVRENRIKYFSKDRDTRDQGDKNLPGEVYKLDVRRCVLLSDIALLNNKNSKKNLLNFFEKMLRYYALIRKPGCIPPNDNELYMHLAYSHSLKSSCISRQVGAVIIGPKGYIFGAGWNDVSKGQIGCGFRTKSDYLNIPSIPKVSSKYSISEFDDKISSGNNEYFCYKDIMSKIQIEKKLKKIKSDIEIESEKLDAVSQEFNLKRLEYCRALHAEENALLQVTKVGGMPVMGGTIHTTTYPCELCAKKIYQTGIRTIYYTEPYPESLSEEVFFEDGNRRIEVLSFEGVKSYSFYRLFKPVFDKKELEIIKDESIRL